MPIGWTPRLPVSGTIVCRSVLCFLVQVDGGGFGFGFDLAIAGDLSPLEQVDVGDDVLRHPDASTTNEGFDEIAEIVQPLFLFQVYNCPGRLKGRERSVGEHASYHRLPIFEVNAHVSRLTLPHHIVPRARHAVDVP